MADEEAGCAEEPGELRWEQFLRQVAPRTRGQRAGGVSTLEEPPPRQHACPDGKPESSCNTISDKFGTSSGHFTDNGIDRRNEMNSATTSASPSGVDHTSAPIGTVPVRDLGHFASLIRHNLPAEEQTRLVNFVQSHVTLGHQEYVALLHGVVQNNVNVGHSFLYAGVEGQSITSKLNTNLSADSERQLTIRENCVDNTLSERKQNYMQTVVAFMDRSVYPDSQRHFLSENSDGNIRVGDKCSGLTSSILDGVDRCVQTNCGTETHGHLESSVVKIYHESNRIPLLTENTIFQGRKEAQYTSLLSKGEEYKDISGESGLSVESQRLLAANLCGNSATQTNVTLICTGSVAIEENRSVLSEAGDSVGNSTDDNLSKGDRRFGNHVQEVTHGDVIIPCGNDVSVSDVSHERAQTHLLTVGSSFPIEGRILCGGQEHVNISIVRNLPEGSGNIVHGEVIPVNYSLDVEGRSGTATTDILGSRSSCVGIKTEDVADEVGSSGAERGGSMNFAEVEWTTAADGRKFASCPVCSRTFYKLHTLLAHHASHTGEKPFPCPVCKKRFAAAGYLKTHLQTHARKRARRKRRSTSGKWFGCTRCGAGFAASGQLKRHRCGPGGALACPGCGRLYQGSGALSLHFRLHCAATARASACDLCGKRYECAQRLAQHRRRHASSHPYSCLACGSWFKSREALSRHSAKHALTDTQKGPT